MNPSGPSARRLNAACSRPIGLFRGAHRGCPSRARCCRARSIPISALPSGAASGPCPLVVAASNPMHSRLLALISYGDAASPFRPRSAQP